MVGVRERKGGRGMLNLNHVELEVNGMLSGQVHAT